MKRLWELFKKDNNAEASDQSTKEESNQQNTIPPFSPDNQAFVDNPYPTYAWLRKNEPLFRSQHGAWVLTRFEDINNALTDPRLGNTPSPYAVVNQRNAERYVCAELANNILPFMDSPKHDEPRKLIGRAFRSHIKDHPPPIESIANQLIDAHWQKGELDLIGDFGTPLSLTIFGEIFGIPEPDLPQLLKWSEWFFYLFSVIPSEKIRQQLDIELGNFRDYFSKLIQLRKQTPGEDVLSQLIQANDTPLCLSFAELVDTAILIFADGVENIDSAIANSVRVLLQHPQQLQALYVDHSLIPLAVDECLRFDPPAQFIARVAQQDLVMHGQSIRKNAGVLLVLASANRDSSQFQNGDTFNIHRTEKGHLGFGRGRHSCIGGPLVKTHVEVALQVLLTHTTNLQLKNQPVQWKNRFGHRWLKQLTVLFS
ncbi:MAG TPA: cytochrome P450 [Gammaproteobacteria bacterium]|nr:cytochrome P450 [Gammaproteobacteria bacterium]